MSHSDNVESNELDTSIDEWKEALEVATFSPGCTIGELSEKLSIPKSTLRRKLRDLINRGMCTKDMSRRTSANGSSIPVVVYRLVKGEEE